MIGTDTNAIPDGLRGVAETGLDQSRLAFDTVFAAARRNAEMMRGASEFARNASLEMTARGFDYAERTMRATLDHAQRLARTRDVQELMQVQSAFLRDRFAALQSATGEIGGLAQGALRRGAEQATEAAQENQQRFQKIAEQNREAVDKVIEQSAHVASDAAETVAH